MDKSETIEGIRFFAVSKTIDAAICGQISGFEAEEIVHYLNNRLQNREQEEPREEIASAAQRVLAYAFRAARAWAQYFDRGTPWEKETAATFEEIATDLGIDSKKRFFTISDKIGDRNIKGAGTVYDKKHLDEWISEEGGAE